MTSSTAWDTTDKRNPVEGAVAFGSQGLTVWKSGRAVMYGPLPLGNVTQIKEAFANQSFREFDKWQSFGKWMGFHGGNVSITVHGFLRGAFRRQQKSWLEFVRNLQSTLAHIPGNVGAGADNSWGIGNIILYVLSFFFPFSSEMCFQMNMIIKTMEFEHSGHYADEYPYVIVFEKFSFGLLQYILDLVVNACGFLTISSSRFNSGDVAEGGSPDFSLLQTFASNMNQQVSLNDIGITQEMIDNIASSVQTTATTGIGVGQLVSRVTDPLEDEPEDSVLNIPRRYNMSSKIDVNQDWFDAPLGETFPQRFSFAIGDKSSSTEISATNVDNTSPLGSSASFLTSTPSKTSKTKYIYTMALSVVDTIFEDDDSPRYALRAEIERDGTPVYAGILHIGTQYVFDGILGIYFKTFNMSVNSDGYLTHSIAGMVARFD